MTRWATLPGLVQSSLLDLLEPQVPVLSRLPLLTHLRWQKTSWQPPHLPGGRPPKHYRKNHPTPGSNLTIASKVPLLCPIHRPDPRRLSRVGGFWLHRLFRGLSFCWYLQVAIPENSPPFPYPNRWYRKSICILCCNVTNAAFFGLFLCMWTVCDKTRQFAPYSIGT